MQLWIFGFYLLPFLFWSGLETEEDNGSVGHHCRHTGGDLSNETSKIFKLNH